MKQHLFHPKEKDIGTLPADMPQILDIAHRTNNRLFLALVIAYFTGMRISEIISLKGPDIDFKQCSVHVQRRAWNLPGTKGQKKNRPIKERIIPAPKELLMVLRINRPVNWYFPNQQTGVHIRKETLIRELKDWIEKYWTYPFTFHSIRHVFATVKCDENPLYLAKILGHSNLQSTLIYTHFSKEENSNDEKESYAEKDYNREDQRTSQSCPKTDKKSKQDKSYKGTTKPLRSDKKHTDSVLQRPWVISDRERKGLLCKKRKRDAFA